MDEETLQFYRSHAEAYAGREITSHRARLEAFLALLCQFGLQAGDLTAGNGFFFILSGLCRFYFCIFCWFFLVNFLVGFGSGRYDLLIVCRLIDSFAFLFVWFYFPDSCIRKICTFISC